MNTNRLSIAACLVLLLVGFWAMPEFSRARDGGGSNSGGAQVAVPSGAMVPGALNSGGLQRFETRIETRSSDLSGRGMSGFGRGETQPFDVRREPQPFDIRGGGLSGFGRGEVQQFDIRRGPQPFDNRGALSGGVIRGELQPFDIRRESQLEFRGTGFGGLGQRFDARQEIQPFDFRGGR